MYAIKTLSDQALRAMYNVLVLLKLSLILKQKCYCLIEWLHLCYCTLLNCGGIYDYKEIDKIQLNVHVYVSLFVNLSYLSKK